jgi:hypothetical protein
VDNLFSAGYTPGNLVDILLVIGDKVITNYLYSVSEISIDFPAAPALKSQNAGAARDQPDSTLINKAI